jgi:hypothetical protein
MLGDRHGEAETLALLGSLHLSVGRLPLGRQHVDGALRIFRKIADPHGEGQGARPPIGHQPQARPLCRGHARRPRWFE